MSPFDRVWGYTGASGMVQGLSAGYFLWDLIESARNVDVHVPGSLAHAASALAVSMLGFVGHLDYGSDSKRADTSSVHSAITMDLISSCMNCRHLF